MHRPSTTAEVLPLLLRGIGIGGEEPSSIFSSTKHGCSLLERETQEMSSAFPFPELAKVSQAKPD